MKTLGFFSCLLLFYCNDGFSQVASDTNHIYQPFQERATTQKSRWIKPAVIAVAYPAAVYYCYRNLDTRIQKTSQATKNGVKTTLSGAVTDMGLGKFHAIALGSTSIVAFIGKNEKLKRTVITWAGALLINSVISEKIKNTFQRHRPNTGDPYNTFDWQNGTGLNRSFASAHTSNAFTTATIFATIYKDQEWVPYVAYGLATLVGASRVYDNAHWASDVMTGAALGYVSAKAMNGIYKLAAKKILFLPQAGLHGGSLSIVYTF